MHTQLRNAFLLALSYCFGSTAWALDESPFLSANPNLSAPSSIDDAPAIQTVPISTQTNSPAPAVKRSVPAKSVPAAPTKSVESKPKVEPVAIESTSLVPIDDVWQRIRIGFAMPALETELVQRHENWYADRPDYVKRMFSRSQRYLYHIVEEVEKRGMPTEVALLPMIESAFNPKAYSRAHASGIWQFIPSTGKDFGLQQNWWYDGRRDVMAATNAALDYLQRLHRMFGSWELALAAYNWGEGSVGRAIARNEAAGEPTDYLSLRMPDETRQYVPKLLAIKNIVMNPAAYGIALNTIPNQPYFAKVKLDKHIDVALAAKLAGMPLDEFTSLNPAYNRPVINTEQSRSILLPVERVDLFKENLANYDKPLVSWQAYQARKGEKLDKIAKRFDISVSTLRATNTVGGPNRLKSAVTLLVPRNDPANTDELTVAAVSAPTQAEAFERTAAVRDQDDDKQPAKRLVHIVKRGETLFSIASRYQVQPATIKQMNRLRSNVVALGRKLLIHSGDSRKVRQEAKSIRLAKAEKRAEATGRKQEKSKPSYAVVKRGDTLTSIARRFKVGVHDLQRWNKISKRGPAPGSRIIVAKND